MYKPYNKYRGLMFRKLKKSEIVVLKNYKQEKLHTLFVFYPIDIIFLNDKKKVIDIRRDIKPFTLKIKTNKKAKHVLELRSKNTKSIKIGQIISF